MKKKTAYILLLFLLALSFSVSAQPGCPNKPVPFGFIEVLMLGGAGYGSYKAYKLKKEKS